MRRLRSPPRVPEIAPLTAIIHVTLPLLAASAHDFRLCSTASFCGTIATITLSYASASSRARA
jgi:hypothetical protein